MQGGEGPPPLHTQSRGGWNSLGQWPYAGNREPPFLLFTKRVEGAGFLLDNSRMQGGGEVLGNCS